MGIEKAGFWPRGVAFIIDETLLVAIDAVIVAAINFLTGPFTESGLPVLNWITGLMALILVVSGILVEFTYYGWFWSRSGQSIGMRIMHIRVVTKDGSPLSFLRGGLRGTVGYFISALVLGLGFFWAALDRDKEAWHDKLFKTSVLAVIPVEKHSA